jgi:2-phospho-L-lactate guanylyltransferase
MMQVLLPLKEFAAAKQRLAGVLSAPERAQLFEAMVDDVLNVLTAQPAVERVVICSRDRAAVWLARYYEVEFLHEDQLAPSLDRSAPDGALNAVVNAAARRCLAQGAGDLLVVHGDLPLLSESDLSRFIARHGASSGPAVTIAPDRRHSGTNLLAWRGLPEFTTCYGANSLQQHCAQARALGVEPALCDLDGARCDIDEPEDLMLLSQAVQRRPAGPIVAARTYAYLQASGIAARIALMLQGGTGADSAPGDSPANDLSSSNTSTEVRR